MNIEKEQELRKRARAMSLDLLHRKTMMVSDALEIGDCLGYSNRQKMEVQCIHLKEVLEVLGTEFIRRVSDEALGKDFVDNLLKRYED